MDRWSVNSANMRFLTEKIKSSRARKRAKRRKRVKENKLQDSEKEKNLSHAAKVSSSRVGTANPDLAERENTSRAETQKTVSAEKAPHTTTFAENKNVRMARGLDGRYIVTTGCTVMEAPSLAEAMRIIAEYEHTGS